MSYSLSRRLPQPIGLRGVLPVLFAAAGLGAAIACTAEPSVHTHEVDLAAGDFVRAVVKQQSDVRVELLDPDGREILHVDGPNTIVDDEEVAAIAERAGLYRMNVRGCPESVAAAECYTLVLDPPRPATAADRRRAEAVRTTQEAVDAMAAGKPVQLQLTTRERALELWSGVGERRRVAEELYQLGVLHRILHQFEPAARRLHQATEVWAALGEITREAEALNEAGLACGEAGHVDEALEDSRQALAKARSAGDRTIQKSALNNIGLQLNRLGERREALSHLQQALDLAQDLGGAGQANILNNLGFIYGDLGRPQEAIELHRKALARPDATPPEKAAAYNNLGAVYDSVGNWAEAIENYDRAIGINRELGNQYLLASTLNNLGMAQQKSGNLEAARDSYQEALTLAGAMKNLDVQIHAANNFAILLDQKLGRKEEALQQWKNVVLLTAKHPVLGHVGLAARAAVEHGENRPTEARETFRKAIAASQSKAELRFAADLTLRLARLERDLGDLAAAAEHAQTAVESIESQRNRVASLDQRATFLASNQSFYEVYIRILMDLHQQDPAGGHGARALRISEQARARSFLDLLGEAEADLRKDVPPDLLERERRARVSLRERDLYHMELIHRQAGAEQITQAAERLNEALDESEEVEALLRARSESYAALTQPQPLDVREIQRQVLNDQTLLLEYSLGEERSYLWALTASTFQSFELPGRRQIEKLALDFYNAITARNETGAVDLKLADAEAHRAGLALSRLILEPVEPLLGDRILLVVGDGVLQYVPFVALPLPSASGQRVVHRNQVVSLPSASTLALLRRDTEGRPSPAKTLAVLADPVFPGDPRLGRIARIKPDPKPRHRGPLRAADQLSLERLTFSRIEAENILAFAPDPDQHLKALDFDASYTLATSGELAKYRYVHFATHGLIDSQQPKLSKLALSQFDKTGRPQDGFLRLADIYNLELNADLVALSACQTALGKEVRGEGLVGLTRGFMYAGAARVLASLWSVEDRATAKLMKSFYRYLLNENLPAAEALRRAQLDMARSPQHGAPYYWAGFSLQGEWK